ncbi:hypothetical protein COOONC_09053 [Cooperia oncophora]
MNCRNEDGSRGHCLPVGTIISSRARQIKESIGDLNSQMASGYYWYRIPLQINLPLQWMLMSEA